MNNRSYSLSTLFFALCLSNSAFAETTTNAAQPKVLNGENAANLGKNLLPWQAAILTNPHPEYPDAGIISGCGAVIIGEHWVVTAAHCAEPAADLSNTLIAGLTNIRQFTEEPVDPQYKFTIVEKIWHENYQESIPGSGYIGSGQLDHDIAVMRIKESLFTVGKPIKIATIDEQSQANNQFANTWNASSYSAGNLIASGWGAMQPEFMPANDLQVVKLGGIPMSQCETSYPITENSHFICADSNNPAIKKDVCSGDSGGPLVWQNPNRVNDADFGLRLVGVTSFGPFCKEKNENDPTAQENGLYTELAQYRTWIEAKTGLNLDGVVASNFDHDPFKLVKEDKKVQDRSDNSGSGSGGSVPLTALLSLGLISFLRRKQ